MSKNTNDCLTRSASQGARSALDNLNNCYGWTALAAHGVEK